MGREIPQPDVREAIIQTEGELATPAIILASSGKLWLPRSADWTKAYIDELVRFTGRDDREDDQVDITAYAAWQLPRICTDPDPPPLIEWRPNYGSDAAERGLCLILLAHITFGDAGGVR